MAEKEFIEREAVNKLLHKEIERTWHRVWGSVIWKLSHKISQIPAADVVEVVRCCDCVHKQENPDIDNTCYLTCNVSWGLKGVIDPTDFCSYGERRAEE